MDNDVFSQWVYDLIGILGGITTMSVIVGLAITLVIVVYRNYKTYKKGKE